MLFGRLFGHFGGHIEYANEPNITQNPWGPPSNKIYCLGVKIVVPSDNSIYAMCGNIISFVHLFTIY